MNDAKFTEGPWEKIPQNDGSNFIAKRIETNTLTGAGLRLVAHVLRRKDSASTDESNADLIAAAPEMYEALKSILGFFDSGEFVRDTSHDFEQGWHLKMIPMVKALADANAALAKAVKP
jgi:hypothetical protein